MKIFIAMLMIASVCLIKAKTYQQLDQLQITPSAFICHFVDGNHDKLSMDVSNIVLDRKKEIFSLKQAAWSLNHEKLEISVDFSGEAHGHYINENDQQVTLHGLCTKKKST